MTALKMTHDEALALADDWIQGTTFHADSKGANAIMLVLAEEVRRLREREAGLLDQHHRDSAELRRVCAERDEARADDRTAMGYLAQVRRVVGGEDFPDMVRRVERLAKDAGRYRQLIENFSQSYPMTQEEPAEHTLVFEWRQSDLSEAGWSIHDAIDAAMEASNAG